MIDDSDFVLDLVNVLVCSFGVVFYWVEFVVCNLYIFLCYNLYIINLL